MTKNNWVCYLIKGNGVHMSKYGGYFFVKTVLRKKKK